MQALVYEESLSFQPNYPDPLPAVGEALIKVRIAGICSTDMELMKGYLDFQGIPGHEFVGTVIHASGFEDWEGHRVVGDINAACLRCPTCLAGRPTHCPNRTTLGIQGRDGAFAEYITLPVANLYEVPDTLPDMVAAFTEPLAAACEIQQQVHVRSSDKVVVIGDGKLGLLCAQVLAQTGCDLTILGHHEKKLEIVGRLGIKTTLKPVPSLRHNVDIVIEATGNPDGYHLAYELVRPRGTIVLKSTYHGSTTISLNKQVVNEITVVGSRCGPFEPALRLLEQKRILVTPLISACYPLNQALAAFHYAAQPGVLKVLLEI
jgi:alcohol dehydrogenase